MGSWFSNIHIKRNETASTEKIVDCLKEVMSEKKYLIAQGQEDADVLVAVVAQEDYPWISVYSQALAHDDPQSCSAIATPISAGLHTDVLGISCFDSDYLYLNLINEAEKLDAWVGIGQGKEIGITRRSALTPWKKKVLDYPAFSSGAKESYILAEEFLQKAAPCLNLSMERCVASVDHLEELGLDNNTTCLYFKRCEDAADENRVRLELCSYDSNLPCLLERKSNITFANEGRGAKGISLCFMGPYVEQDALTFSDVSLKIDAFSEDIPITLSKTQLPDGQWAFYYHDPEFEIPPVVSKRMNKSKRHQLMMERWICVSFIPHGDPRKTLDITVALVPDEDPEGQGVWNVWQRFGSKSAFIAWHNRIWKKVYAVEENPDNLYPLLKETDFD